MILAGLAAALISAAGDASLYLRPVGPAYAFAAHRMFWLTAGLQVERERGWLSFEVTAATAGSTRRPATLLGVSVGRALMLAPVGENAGWFIEPRATLAALGSRSSGGVFPLGAAATLGFEVGGRAELETVLVTFSVGAHAGFGFNLPANRDTLPFGAFGQLWMQNERERSTGPVVDGAFDFLRLGFKL